MLCRICDRIVISASAEFASEKDMLYFSKRFTATATGSIVRAVVCEKCQAEFYYELERVECGEASAPYYLGQKSAEARAERKAQKNLARKLAYDLDPVPCPNCQWVNISAVKACNKLGGKFWIQVVLLPFAVVVVVSSPIQILFALAEWIGNPVLWYVLLVCVVLAMIVAMILIVLLIRWGLQGRRINPNQWVDGQPAVPPNTPTAVPIRKPGQADAIMKEEWVL